MKSRNVIISLFLVLALFVMVFMKIRSEPGRKITFNRNLSRVEYSSFALCLMSCQSITANDMDYVLRNGEVLGKTLDRNKQSCPSYVLKGQTKNGLGLTVFVIQCGRVTKVSKCYRNDNTISCECRDENILPVSSVKSNSNAFPS